jgi:hypothetical protein
MAAETNDEDRLLVRDGWKHYRRTYSLTEVRWGLACAGFLVLLVGWVIWKGRHPDPALFSDGASLLEGAGKSTVTVAPPGAPPVTGAPAVAASPAAPAAAGQGAIAEGAAAPAAGQAAAGETGSAVGRGPLPRGLAGSGWTEDKVVSFDEENLYVKIDGRADYFRAFHFKRMHSVLLTSSADSNLTIDVEMYDVSNTANALGAYSGERPPNAKVEVTEAGLHHFDRNALYLARGPYYIRVIGSDETPPIVAKLRQIADKMLAEVGGEPLPWAYGLFIGQMNLGADKITYSAKNAFSLGFANDFWAVRPEGKDTDLELFVSARASAADGRKIAGQLKGSFLEMGEAAGKAGAVPLVKDRFLGLYSGAGSSDRFVYGVRGAASQQAAGAELARLHKALAGAPPALLQRAVPAPAAPEAPAAEKPSSAPAEDTGPEEK